MAKAWDDMTPDQQLEFLRDTKADKQHLSGMTLSIEGIGSYLKTLEKRIEALEKAKK